MANLQLGLATDVGQKRTGNEDAVVALMPPDAPISFPPRVAHEAAHKREDSEGRWTLGICLAPQRLARTRTHYAFSPHEFAPKPSGWTGSGRFTKES